MCDLYAHISTIKKRLFICSMRPDRYDALIYISVFLKSSTIFITMMVLAMSADVTGASIRQASSAMEVNPILRLIIDVQNAGKVGGLLIIPASLLAVYHIAKSALYKKNPYVLQFFVWIIFYSVLFNIMADAGTFVGLALRWGII